MDVKLLFTVNILILAVVSSILIFKHIRNPKNLTIKFLTYTILLHSFGFVLFILRNQIPDFLSIIVANMLFAIGTLFLYMAVRTLVDKKLIWQNKYVIPLLMFFLGYMIFTYIAYDTKTRILIYYTYCAIFVFPSGWLLWTTQTPGFKFFDKVSAILFFIISFIFIGIVMQATTIRIETYYFGNKNIFMIVSIIIMDIISLWTLLALKYRITKERKR